MSKISLAVAAALALVATPAMAEDAGFYAGVGVGTFGLEENDFEGTLDFDEDDTGFRVFGGWQFNQYFGIEGGYNAGPEPSGTLGDIATDGVEADVSIEVKGFDLFLVGKLPLGESFYAFGKAGMIAWDADIDAVVREDDGEGGVITTPFSDDASGEDFAYGAGFGFNLGENAAIQIDYTVFDFDGTDGDVLSGNFVWKFR